MGLVVDRITPTVLVTVMECFTMTISDIPNCAKCGCKSFHHREGICFGDIGCTCTKFVEPEKIKVDNTVALAKIALNNLSAWKGDGWDYQKKYGKSQKDMIKLYVTLGKNIDEIQDLLRCKRSSIRGRMSELRNTLYVKK